MDGPGGASTFLLQLNRLRVVVECFSTQPNFSLYTHITHFYSQLKKHDTVDARLLPSWSPVGRGLPMVPAVSHQMYYS